MSRRPPVFGERAIFAALRRQSFVRTYRSQSLHNPHIYERTEDFNGAPLLMSAQIWPDGTHRISHSWSGYEVVQPTEFTAAVDVRSAIADQLSKVHITQEHVRKVRPQ